MSTLRAIFICLWIPATAAITLSGGGCPGFILMCLVGAWIDSGIKPVQDGNSGK